MFIVNIRDFCTIPLSVLYAYQGTTIRTIVGELGNGFLGRTSVRSGCVLHLVGIVIPIVLISLTDNLLTLADD